MTTPRRSSVVTWEARRIRVLCAARTARYWIYADLSAKQDKVTIDEAELVLFRTLATSYAAVSAAQLTQLLEKKSLVEICHDEHPEVQERHVCGNP